MPLPLQEKVREELSRMEPLGVISKVDQPIEWCTGMVAIPKKSGAIHVCVDLKPLNESVLREVKLDANSGFWQITLSSQSRLPTIFCFKKLPFGIASAPEHYQKRMSKILSRLDGVACQMDDVLVFGKDKVEHDTRLTAVRKWTEAAGAMLNREKCKFGQERIKFLGHVIDQRDVRADPEKTTALVQRNKPTNISLRWFMGMANQLGKFSPCLAKLSQPLCQLLSTWQWKWSSSTQQCCVTTTHQHKQKYPLMHPLMVGGLSY